ncbi:hypothetical protein BDF19DRAFT_293847 [Syncephalis fuscata]|nr:hypothetical protein BDF19DRAFT_293847 [Syncephalis fuscata]
MTLAYVCLIYLLPTTTQPINRWRCFVFVTRCVIKQLPLPLLPPRSHLFLHHPTCSLQFTTPPQVPQQDACTTYLLSSTTATIYFSSAVLFLFLITTITLLSHLLLSSILHCTVPFGHLVHLNTRTHTTLRFISLCTAH